MRQPISTSLNILAILLVTGLLSSASASLSGNLAADVVQVQAETPHVQLSREIGLGQGVDIATSINNKRTPEPHPNPQIKAAANIAADLAKAAEKLQIDDIINKIAKTASDNAKSFIKVRREGQITQIKRENLDMMEKRDPNPSPQIKAAANIAADLAKAAEKLQIDDLINKIAKSAADNAKSFIKVRREGQIAQIKQENSMRKREPEPKPEPEPGLGDILEGIFDVIDIVSSDEAAKKKAKSSADAAAGLIKRRRAEQIERIKQENNMMNKREPEPVPILGSVLGEVIEAVVDVVASDEAAKKIAKAGADAAAGLIKRRREEQIAQIKEENREVEMI